MGQQVSKNIRSRLADSTLEELLVDDKYIEELEGSIAQLPKQSQNNLARILASTGCQVDPPKDNINCPTYRLRPLLALESADIGLSDDVAEALKQSYCNLIHQSATTNNVPLLAADFYEYTCKVETRRKVDKILWRFLTSFYYELVSELDDTKQRLSKTDKGSVAFVVAVICRPGKHDPLSVQEKVMDWVRIGRRYQGYMEALSPGCLIMFPDQISELIWEKYIPIKGDAFEKAVDFLRSLGIVSKCEEGGWNDLSLQILDTLRKPFQSFIPFQFRCNPKSQSNVASKRPPTSVICDADNRFLEQPVFGHKRTAAIRGKSPKTKSRRPTSDSRHDGGSRKRQRTGPSLVHPQPLVLPNDLVSRREHDTITTPKRQAHTKDQSREPLVDISTSATNGNNLNEYARTGSSFCESTGRRCLGANSIEAVLNHHNGPAARSTSARGSVPNPGSRRVSNGPELAPSDTREELSLDAVPIDQPFNAAHANLATALLRVVRFEKITLEQIVLERPDDILGGIWFGGPQGYPPFVSLRLSRALDDVIRLRGQEVFVPGPSPDPGSTVTGGAHLIQLGMFRQMIRQEGFGPIYWNVCGADAFVTIEVTHEGLASEFMQGATVLN